MIEDHTVPVVSTDLGERGSVDEEFGTTGSRIYSNT